MVMLVCWELALSLIPTGTSGASGLLELGLASSYRYKPYLYYKQSLLKSLLFYSNTMLYLNCLPTYAAISLPQQ